jgi:plastocyanin
MGGGMIAALSLPPAIARAEDIVEIEMAGRSDGSHVWFNPIGIRIRPGQTIRWINRDKGNSHTATAYHPANFGRPRRIPQAATPWHSDYLLPDEFFSTTLTETGIYDYYCVPHEMAGMVGRIIVGEPEPGGWFDGAGVNDGLPEAALNAFPSVETILIEGAVRRA